MDLSHLRPISNDYRDCRLLSLNDWKHAHEIEIRDQGGPYAVLQEGYDPADLYMTADEFLLGKSGRWLPTSAFFRLSAEVRRREFIFGTAAEVIDLLQTLTGRAKLFGKNEPCCNETGPENGDDNLPKVFAEAKLHAKPPSA